MTNNKNTPKVIIRFKGGLANQVYQLAAGLYLANLLQLQLYYSDVYFRYIQNSRDLVVPSIYDKKILLRTEFPFGIALGRTPLRMLRKLLPWDSMTGRQVVICDKFFKSLVHEGVGSLKPALNRGQDIILDGYFHIDTVLQDSGVLELVDIFSHQKNESCGIHVRLGDYLNSPYNRIYRLVDEHYISSAYAHLLRLGMNESAPVKIFSDSPEQAFKIVKRAIPLATVFLEPSRSSLADLRQLSSCRFLILSNSTFSLLSWHLSRTSLGVIPAQWFQMADTDLEQFPISSRLIRI